MKIDILTLFPDMFKGPFEESIVKRAADKKLVEIKIHNLRKWTKDKRKTVDDRPYGGGVGMILMIEPVYQALKDLKNKKTKVILLTPQGKPYHQKKAQQLSKLNHLIFICGHYEGFDERIRKLVDEEISIGDYILTGGELPAMIIVDSLVRLIPGVLEKAEATQNESFSKLKIVGPKPTSLGLENSKIGNCLEYPQYTRPADFKGWKVPVVLLSGHHKEIEKWRQEQSLKRTRSRRPDLLRS